MKLPEGLAPLARRWYVILIGLLATAGLLIVGAARAPLNYSASATVLLVPSQSSIPEGGNPFLYLGGLIQARDVVVKNLSTEAARGAVLDSAGGGDFTVSGDPTSGAPMILISATGDSESATAALRTALLEALPDQVAAIQERASTPQEAAFQAFVVADDSPPEPQTKGRLRLLLALAGVGVGLTFLAAIALDAVLRWRKADPRTAQGSAHPDDEPQSGSQSHRMPEGAGPAASDEPVYERKQVEDVALAVRGPS